MSSLSSEQKQLLFDYAIGLTTEKESAQAEALISLSEEAAQLLSGIKSSISPLDSIEFGSCPDMLVDGIVRRVSNLTNGRHRLQQLLAAEQKRPVTTGRSFWHNFSEMAAIAAAILLVAGVLIPSLGVARQKYWQQRCQTQLGSIFQGLSNYISDYDGQPPTVATKAGSPWWKVGYQGQENYSNTRHIWLLVKGAYVEAGNFGCPGKSQGRTIKLDPSQIQNFNDFPERRYITYSIRIRCPNTPCVFGQGPLMSDLNPIFDGTNANSSEELSVQLDDRSFTINSRNHRSRGQNVLFGDGSVRFIKVRFIGDAKDDLFTLQQMNRGFEIKGDELPTCESDFFFAP